MKKIFVNLKDWFNLEENKIFAREITDTDIVVFPSTPYLYIYSEIRGIEIGTQDVSMFSSGAHTGAVSIEHLKDFNVEWVILNHKELKINDIEILKGKLYNCISHNLNVILCIKDITDLDFLFKALSDVEDYSNIYIAYEPIVIKDIESIKKNINLIKEKIGEAINRELGLLYGGSISPLNIDGLNVLNVDGFLISRHALNNEELKTIVNLVK